jgi:hypothetical protein
MNDLFNDFSICSFDAVIKLEKTIKPTASILISDEPFSIASLKPITQRLYLMGCRHFMTWGKSAEVLHDLIDEILENDGFLEAVTTSHADEPANDVAWFFLNATFPGVKGVRSRAIASEKAEGLAEFMRELSRCKSM